MASRLQNCNTAMNHVVVLLGCVNDHCTAFSDHVVGFGWSLEGVANLQDLRKLSKIRNLVAVFFDAETMGLPWEQALRSVLDNAPAALPVACHKFSEAFAWPELAEAGAFHAVSLPFDPDELRQSLGFVWGAMLRRSRNVIALANRDCA